MRKQLTKRKYLLRSVVWKSDSAKISTFTVFLGERRVMRKQHHDDGILVE